jgi:hypothetical protein
MLGQTPKAEGSEFGFPQGFGESFDAEGQPDAMGMLNAATAAYHADIAAKHAASTANHATALAQWVSHLWQQHEALQAKVRELEDWKKRTLEDMRKLREEHKQLRKKLGPSQDDDFSQGVKKAATMPSISASAETESIQGPPGLDLPALPTDASTEEAESPSGAVMDSGDGGQNEGVSVKDHAVDGRVCQRAEWRINHLSTRLRGCMGRALVSPPFSALEMEDVRLMIYPDLKESATGPRSKRQKELYNKKVSDGPLDGCLKLKVPNCPPPHTLKYYLTVGAAGAHRKGPFTHNFADCTVSEPAEFGMDWLAQVDTDGGLTVSVDIVQMP